MSDDIHDTQDNQESHEEQTNNEEPEAENATEEVTKTSGPAARQEVQQDEDQAEQGGQSTDETPDSSTAPTDSADSADSGGSAGSKQEPAEDLFDLMGTAGAAFKKKKPEKPETSTTQKKAAAKKPEEKRFAAGNTIVYSGHKIELEEEMTAEGLLAFLEDDFPELTKDTTEFTHDETRSRIVPTRKALKKGARTDHEVEGGSSPEPRRSRSPQAVSPIQVETQIKEGPAPPVRRVLDVGGVYEIRNTTLGSFIVRIPPRINLQLIEGAYLGLPKAPVSLLSRIIEVFQQYPDREALATIVYDHRSETHRLVWVPQQATATSIDYDPVPESEEVTVFCEIHSHNTMPAYFSSTDDGYEVRSTALYGVVGHVHRRRPSAAFRFSCGTHFRGLSARDLFEAPWKIKDLISEKAL